MPNTHLSAASTQITFDSNKKLKLIINNGPALIDVFFLTFNVLTIELFSLGWSVRSVYHHHQCQMTTGHFSVPAAGQHMMTGDLRHLPTCRPTLPPLSTPDNVMSPVISPSVDNIW